VKIDIRELFGSVLGICQKDLRAALVGSRGLLNDRNQRIAELEHKEMVCRRHGLEQVDFDLLGEAWCVKFVNARRYIERALSAQFNQAAWECGIDFVSRIELPLRE
jgi:hypothetical protein